MAQDLYLIGRILKPQGVRGEVKVEPVSMRPERFELLDDVLVGEDSKKTYIIEAIRLFKRFALIKFAGVDDRNGAEELRDKGIYTTKELLLSPGENEYFVHDLIDCRVSTPTELDVATVVDVRVGVAFHVGLADQQVDA